jgi:hypothetical protein
MTKHCRDFSGGTFVTDFELASGELIFAVLVFRRNDVTSHSAMEMFAAFPGVTARLGVAAGAHHRYSD